jgi:DNA mismatch endonuclease (patch repair protein)
MKLTGRIGQRIGGRTDCYTPTERSWVMSRIRSRGNRSTELRFIRLCRKFGISGWRRGSKLFGSPDFVFFKCKVVVFIDGDFWHGNAKTRRLPKSNAEYWNKKIRSNRRRDSLVKRRLEADGWRVVRIWESDLRRDAEAVMAKVRLFV